MRYEIILWFLWFLKLPPGRIGCALRTLLLPSRIGSDSKIWDNVHIDYPSNLTIGDRCSVNRGTILHCGGGISIGDDVLIGPGVTIYSQNHNYADRSRSIATQGYTRKPVIIGSDVWIAANAIILPGVSIGDHAVIAAGAIVTKPVAAGEVVAGIPARTIGHRF